MATSIDQFLPRRVIEVQRGLASELMESACAKRGFSMLVTGPCGSGKSTYALRPLLSEGVFSRIWYVAPTKTNVVATQTALTTLTPRHMNKFFGWTYDEIWKADVVRGIKEDTVMVLDEVHTPDRHVIAVGAEANRFAKSALFVTATPNEDKPVHAMSQVDVRFFVAREASYRWLNNNRDTRALINTVWDPNQWKGARTMVTFSVTDVVTSALAGFYHQRGFDVITYTSSTMNHLRSSRQRSRGIVYLIRGVSAGLTIDAQLLIDTAYTAVETYVDGVKIEEVVPCSALEMAQRRSRVGRNNTAATVVVPDRIGGSKTRGVLAAPVDAFLDLKTRYDDALGMSTPKGLPDGVTSEAAVRATSTCHPCRVAHEDVLLVQDTAFPARGHHFPKDVVNLARLLNGPIRNSDSSMSSSMYRLCTLGMFNARTKTYYRAQSPTALIISIVGAAFGHIYRRYIHFILKHCHVEVTEGKYTIRCEVLGRIHGGYLSDDVQRNRRYFWKVFGAAKPLLIHQERRRRSTVLYHSLISSRRDLQHPGPVRSLFRRLRSYNSSYNLRVVVTEEGNPLLSNYSELNSWIQTNRDLSVANGIGLLVHIRYDTDGEVYEIHNELRQPLRLIGFTPFVDTDDIRQSNDRVSLYRTNYFGVIEKMEFARVPQVLAAMVVVPTLATHKPARHINDDRSSAVYIRRWIRMLLRVQLTSEWDTHIDWNYNLSQVAVQYSQLRDSAVGYDYPVTIKVLVKRVLYSSLNVSLNGTNIAITPVAFTLMLTPNDDDLQYNVSMSHRSNTTTTRLIPGSVDLVELLDISPMDFTTDRVEIEPDSDDEDNGSYRYWQHPELLSQDEGHDWKSGERIGEASNPGPQQRHDWKSGYRLGEAKNPGPETGPASTGPVDVERLTTQLSRGRRGSRFNVKTDPSARMVTDAGRTYCNDSYDIIVRNIGTNFIEESFWVNMTRFAIATQGSELTRERITLIMRDDSEQSYTVHELMAVLCDGVPRSDAEKTLRRFCRTFASTLVETYLRSEAFSDARDGSDTFFDSRGLGMHEGVYSCEWAVSEAPPRIQSYLQRANARQQLRGSDEVVGSVNTGVFHTNRNYHRHGTGVVHDGEGFPGAE